jgi:hypothetical protein
MSGGNNNNMRFFYLESREQALDLPDYYIITILNVEFIIPSGLTGIFVQRAAHPERSWSEIKIKKIHYLCTPIKRYLYNDQDNIP